MGFLNGDDKDVVQRDWSERGGLSGENTTERFLEEESEVLMLDMLERVTDKDEAERSGVSDTVEQCENHGVSRQWSRRSRYSEEEEGAVASCLGARWNEMK